MIRQYDPGDENAVIAVWEKASRLAHPFLSKAFLAEERQAIRWEHLPMAETWVWESSGRVVGFLSLVGDEIGAIFVDPDFQRSGIGRALVDHARARRATLEVEVFRKNSVGRAFYAKYGFEPMLHRVHEPTGQELIRLRLGKESSE